MKNSLVLTVVIATVVISGCQPKPEKTNEDQADVYEIAEAGPRQPSQEELIQRGKYLVTVAGCNDCHSPKIMTPQGPAPDPDRMLSGHDQNEKLPPMTQDAGRNGWIMFSMGLTSAVGPWGVSYAANLTPDETGIGSWTFDNFKTALRKGKYKGLEGSRDLLPPMPWQMYRSMSDEDLLSIFSYLKSLPKVNNLVPAPIPPAQPTALNTKH